MTQQSGLNVGACVFDAYGTLFDVNSAARGAADTLGPNWQPLAEIWRQKQLQYTWLRSLQNRHADFWQVTGDALDFAMASLEITDNGLRERLMELYLQLSAFPEVRSVLESLKAAGIKTAILSNGSPRMLASAVENAQISDLLDAVLSVEEVGVYKPHPKVYALAEQHLGLPADRMSFQSSNSWDAYGAKAYGYNVVWCNRYGQEQERLPGEPDAQIRNLDELLPILGLSAA